MGNNAYSAAKFLVDTYESTGAVGYLDKSCYHNKESVIETLMLAYMNKDIYVPKGHAWPWSELKIAIMHRCDWRDVYTVADYEQLHMYAAGRLLDRHIDDIDLTRSADAIVYSTKKSKATTELAKVLHDLKLAQFAVTGQGVNCEEVLRAFDCEFESLFIGDRVEFHKRTFREMIHRRASQESVNELFCMAAFANRYGTAFKTRLTKMAELF